MNQVRQLAAIMFTDIVGYTAIMGDDEEEAFALLQKNRSIHSPLIKRFNGNLIKELGDGTLVSFSNVTDAVTCAVAIQQSCTAANELKLRIGIHLGEVVFEKSDAFGDGVNVASRLQSLAPVGGILISEAVYNIINNKKSIDASFAGERELKNVKGVMKVYEVHPAKNDSPTMETFHQRATPEKSIAVLPFINMSNDPEQEYFSDGITEDILTSLSSLKNLKVAGRTSSFQFKGKNVDLREIGQSLGVRTVLEGSVRKHGNRIRITAQLIDVTNGFHIWSQKYDRDMGDIFALQDEIAIAITEQLKITLLDEEITRITKAPTQNHQAYELYLKGVFNINRRGSSVLIGLKHMEEAIQLDPSYSLALAGYGRANFLAAFYNFTSGSSVMPKIKSSVDSALLHDQSESEAYFALAHYHIGLDFDFKKAEENFLKAIELHPRHAQAYSLLAMTYYAFTQGKFEKAEELGQIAIGLEPLSAIDHADFAWTLYSASKLQRALETALIGIDLDPNSFLAQRVAGLCYIALERYDEAISIFTTLISKSNRHQHALNGLIWAYCRCGKMTEAAELMKELELRAGSEYISGCFRGISAAHFGDVEDAFEFLEQAYEDHDPTLITLKYACEIPDSLRADARFNELLKKIGFPETPLDISGPTS